MFNVRPNALSPWLYVKQPPEDDPPGFRIAPDGSVNDAKRSASFAHVGDTPRIGSAPPIGSDFEDAIRFGAGALYGPADLAMLPHSPVQQALDQIARIYDGFSTKPSSLLDRQTPNTDMATPVGSRSLSPYAIGSSFSSPPAEPSTQVNPVRHLEGDYLAMTEGQFDSPSGELTQNDPRLAPPPMPERLPAPDDQRSPLPWPQANLRSQPNSEPLIGRISPDAEPMSLPASTTSEPNQSATSDGGTDVVPMPAADVQVAQLPQQPKRNPPTSQSPQGPEKLPPSEQRLQVRATTQASRLITWDEVIRKPLPEKIDPRVQQPLPNDWEAAVAKTNPNYLNWTKAAAQKYGIPPELLARLLYKESTYNRNKVSDAGAKGIAQLMPIAVKALGLNPSTFDYFDAEKSINSGAAVLAMYYGEFKDWRKAVAAYNMGNTALRQWFDGHPKATGPNDEVRETVKHVFRGNPLAFEKKP